MSSYNINSPSTAIQFFATQADFAALTGPGTSWPVAIALTRGASGFWDGYEELDIAAAALFRIRQWRAAISLTRSITLTDNSTGNDTIWTENINQTSDMELITVPADERSFAQDVATGTASEMGDATDTLDPLHGGGGVSGTDGSGTPFTSTFDTNPLNFANFGFDGVAIVLNPSPIAYLAPKFSIACPHTTPVTGTPPTSQIDMEADSGDISAWGAFASATDRQYLAKVIVRIPSITGSGNAEINFALGAHEADPPGFTIASMNMTGTVLITPIKSFQFGGVWDQSTCARLLDPHTASPSLVI